MMHGVALAACAAFAIFILSSHSLVWTDLPVLLKVYGSMASANSFVIGIIIGTTFRYLYHDYVVEQREWEEVTTPSLNVPG